MTSPLPAAGFRDAFGRPRVALPTGREAAAFDARVISELGIPERTLVESAGRAAAVILDALHPRGRIAVLAGGGNNGGDGVVLARTLAAWGREVRLLVHGRPEPDPLLHGWPLAPVRLGPDDPPAPAALARADVVVDALLGTGVRGAPREPQASFIRAMNGCGRPVVALDLPSGVDADTGAVEGEAVRADVTVAFGAPKRGSLHHPGRAHGGRLLAVEIGFPPWSAGDASAFLATSGWAAARRPRRSPTTHKNREGRLLLLAGSSAFGGAALLAAGAALRSGVGFLRVAAPAGLRGLVQEGVPEAVFVDSDDDEALRAALRESDAVALGPGLGTGAAAARSAGLLLEERGERPALLDADALNLLAAGTLPAPGDAPTLLTPHPGEAARLLGSEPGEVAAAPESSARRVAERWAADVLLKGTPSLVAPRESGSPLLVGTNGSSDLARAGMGDVLTGAAGGFLARGCGPSSAAGLALHFTGRAAALADAREALLPTDVVRHLPAALGEDPDGGRPALPFVLLDLPPAR